jgi:hypothetical protein
MFFSTGVIHLIVASNDLSDSQFLLLTKKKFAIWLGLLPIPALIMAPFTLDVSNVDLTIAMFPIEVIAVICCLKLIIKRKKE